MVFCSASISRKVQVYAVFLICLILAEKALQCVYIKVPRILAVNVPNRVVVLPKARVIYCFKGRIAYSKLLGKEEKVWLLE